MMMPEAAQKEKLWVEVTKPEEGEALKSTSLKISAFWTLNSTPDLLIPFIDRYFDIIEEINLKRDKEYVRKFNMISPANLGRSEDLAKFKALLEKNTTEETHPYTLFLKNQIEVIESIQKSRELCAKYKESLKAAEKKEEKKEEEKKEEEEKKIE